MFAGTNRLRVAHCVRMGGVADSELPADLTLLDVPRDTAPTDADAYLRSAVAWHFGADTGSKFWLQAAKGLDFDPLAEIHTYADLRRFPNLVDELRSVPVEELVPRGYGSPRPI